MSLLAATGVVSYFTNELYRDSKKEPYDPRDLGHFGRYEFFVYTTSIGVVIAIIQLVALFKSKHEQADGALSVSSCHGPLTSYTISSANFAP